MNLENRAIYNDECSNHHKSDKQDMNEIFSFNMNAAIGRINRGVVELRIVAIEASIGKKYLFARSLQKLNIVFTYG